MPTQTKRIAVLGSTGSIGRSTMEVIAAGEEYLRPVALTAHENTELLLEQAMRFRPRWVVVSSVCAAGRYDWTQLPHGVELLVGSEAVERVAADPEVDLVVSAIVGAAGLRATWAAIAAGKTVALANKESMVVAGPLMQRLAAQTGAQLLPVDSEHSAVFQALQSGRRSEVRRVILTASGGPFRTYSPEQLAEVTPAEALAHPTWRMGRKITVDSATLMNKALEIIEARWLFDLDPDQIRVVIHPQSLVHSMVEFADGSVIAQMSPPDMRLPIQYALTYPERRRGAARQFDWSEAFTCTFEPPDEERFPALRLGLDVARQGGSAGAVLNAANEAAVAEFLAGRLPFHQIVPLCRRVLEAHDFDPQPTFEQLFAHDRWARREVLRWVAA